MKKLINKIRRHTGDFLWIAILGFVQVFGFCVAVFLIIMGLTLLRQMLG